MITQDNPYINKRAETKKFDWRRELHKRYAALFGGSDGNRRRLRDLPRYQDVYQNGLLDANELANSDMLDGL